MGYGFFLEDALLKLFKDNASKIKPDYLYAWCNFTHPTLHERIEHIEKIEREIEIQRSKRF
jgi:Zn-dependent protease with chaperone function